MGKALGKTGRPSDWNAGLNTSEGERKVRLDGNILDSGALLGRFGEADGVFLT